MSRTGQYCTVMLTREELALLRELEFPCTERMLSAARLTNHGYELSGSVGDVEYLATTLGPSHREELGTLRSYRAHESRAVVPGHPLFGILDQRGGVFLQFNEVVERIRAR